jgi:diguanylate cyclase (GGDEF)-like protein
MNILEKIEQLKTILPIDQKMVSGLYALSERSLFMLIILSIISSYFLYPALGFKIILWNFILLAFVSYRFFCTLSFRKNPKKYSLETWHRKFSIAAFITALIFGTLSFLVIPYDDNIQHHLFVIIILVGLSAGSNTALAPDYRISIPYVIIMMFPLLINLLLQGIELHIVMSILLIIYFVAMVMMIIEGYKQRLKITQQEKQISKVKKALVEKQNLLHHFVEKAPLAIFSYDTDLRIIDGNAPLLKLLKSTKEQIAGFDLATLPDADRVIKIMKKALTSGTQTYNGPYHSVKGLDLWIESSCFAFNNNEGKVIGGFGVIHNKTKEHNAIKELEFNAKHDQLTELLNRRGLEEYMENFIQEEKHQSFYSILFYLDLNKFKHINDSLGHKIGDELLIAIANRLNSFISKKCIISRFGGDEFIIVSPFVSKNFLEIQQETHKIIERIQKVFEPHFTINDINLTMQTSIGIVTIDPNINNVEEIIRHADIAMYQAKKSRTNYTSYYNTELDKERKKLFLLQYDLILAMQNNELEMYLQPLVSLEKDRVIASECLIRWNHPTLGLLSPSEFIPISIEAGLISDITWWIIEEVCQLISNLKKENIWKLNYISVNIDAKQLLVNHFVHEFLAKLKKHRLDMGDIMIEITEESIIDNFEDTQEVINQLHKEGIKCAIDDFGTGYSSLSYLKKLSFDTLKIDREFVKDIQYKPEDINLIKMILAIGKQFNYNIVVEGIEDEKQKELLFEIDKELIYQGFLFGKPVRAKTFVKKYLKHS